VVVLVDIKTSSDKGNNGGSSGGGIYKNTEPPGTVISAIKTGIFSNINTVGGQGNSGGSDYAGGGGGASGAISSSTAKGNDGIQINIDGNNYYWAGGGGGGFGGSAITLAFGGSGGGGGGGNYGNSASNPNSMKGGAGGINPGENGEYGSSTAYACKGGDGGEHTGGGGGGGANTTGGNGGSGIVIIRYRKYKELENNLNIATGAGATPDIIIPHILNSNGGNYYKYKNIVYSGGGGSIIEQGKDGEINQYGIGGKGLFYNITSINTEYGRGGDGSYIKTEIEYIEYMYRWINSSL